jgi:hypothetical protein
MNGVKVTISGSRPAAQYPQHEKGRMLLTTAALRFPAHRERQLQQRIRAIIDR